METVVRLEGGFPWGFRLEGSGTSSDPVRISKTINGSKADKAGLSAGDVLCSINDLSLKRMNSNDAMKLVKEANDSLILRVMKPHSMNHVRYPESFSNKIHDNSSKFSDSPLKNSDLSSVDFNVQNVSKNMQNGVNDEKQLRAFSSNNNHASLDSRGTEIFNGVNETFRNDGNNNVCSKLSSNMNKTAAPFYINGNGADTKPVTNVLNLMINQLDTNKNSELNSQTNNGSLYERLQNREVGDCNDDNVEFGSVYEKSSENNSESSQLPKIQMPTITLLKMTRGKENISSDQKLQSHHRNHLPPSSSVTALPSQYNFSKLNNKNDNSVSSTIVPRSSEPNNNNAAGSSTVSPVSYKTKAQMTADWVLHGSESSRSIESDLSLMGTSSSETTTGVLPKDDSGYSDCDVAPVSSPQEADSEASTPRIAITSSKLQVLRQLAASSEHLEPAVTASAAKNPTEGSKSRGRNGFELRRSFSTAALDRKNESVGKRIEIDGDRRLVIYDGIGPTDPETGVPMAPRNSVNKKNQRDWYRCMYRSMHAVKRSGAADDYPFSALDQNSNDSKSKVELNRRHSSVNPVELRPRTERSISSSETAVKAPPAVQPSKLSPRISSSRVTNFESRSSLNLSKNCWKPPDAKYETVVYRNQPNSVEDYIPGIRSSLTSPRMTSSSICSSPRLDDLSTDTDIKKLGKSPHFNYCLTGALNRQSATNLTSQPPGPQNGEAASGPPGSRKAIALYRYRATADGELSFEKGDVIFLYRKLDRTWYEGECDGRSGKFPASYVKMLPAENGDGFTCQSGRESRASSFSVEVRETFGHVVHDFMAESSRELSLRLGDRVTIWRKLDKNWYEGSVGSRHGIFPVQCIQIHPDSNLPAVGYLQNGSTTGTASLNDSFRNEKDTFKSGKSFSNVNSGNNFSNVNSGNSFSTNPAMNLNYHQLISNNSEADSCFYPAESKNHHIDINSHQLVQPHNVQNGLSWTQSSPNSYSADHANGLNPDSSTSNSVRDIRSQDCSYGMNFAKAAQHNDFGNVNSNLSAVPNARRVSRNALCRVQYSYIPRDRDELELKEGDIVEILETFDDGWCLGFSHTSRRKGTFPGNYVHTLR